MEPQTGTYDDAVSRTLVAGMVGGTVSALTGGKFANGAVTSAIQWWFNAEAATEIESRVRATEDARRAVANGTIARPYRAPDGLWYVQYGSDAAGIAMYGESGWEERKIPSSENSCRLQCTVISAPMSYYLGDVSGRPGLSSVDDALGPLDKAQTVLKESPNQNLKNFIEASSRPIQKINFIKRVDAFKNNYQQCWTECRQGFYMKF
jgi:hypothetical protein